MNRRNFAKGAAWTVPVISIAAAAPMIAASTGFPTRVMGWACKMPGNSGAIKHGYRVVLAITPEPQTVVPVQVVLGNGRYAQIVGDAHRTVDGWTFTVDAASSPSTLTVTVSVDGTTHTVAVKAHPHCQETR